VAVTPNTLPGFPVGLQAGDYETVIDLTSLASYTTAFLNGPGGGTVAGAEAALIESFQAHTAYFNIHSTFAPTGEIRGFLVPEPGILGLVGLALAAAFAATRRRRG
jgi:hypothetical protein